MAEPGGWDALRLLGRPIVTRVPQNVSSPVRQFSLGGLYEGLL